MTSPFPKCTVSEAQKHVDFTIAYPSQLPADFTLEGVLVLQDGVLITWSAPKGGYYLYEAPIQSTELHQNPVGKAANVQAMSVNGRYAEYVEGAWYGTSTAEGSIPWENSDAVRTLIWMDDQLEYKLVSSAGKVPNSHRPSPQEMAAFASTVSPDIQPVETAEQHLDLVNAQHQAGFQLQLPSELPPNLIPAKVVYNPANQTICQHYSDRQGIDDNFMVIAKSKSVMPDSQSLLAPPPAEFAAMGSPAAMETSQVALAGADQNMGLLLNNQVDITRICGQQGSTNRGLVWSKDGFTYYILGYRDGSMGYPFVTLMDMTRMASDLLGNPVQAGIDPERLTSLKDAEELLGRNIPFPTVMLPGYNFDHLSLFTADNGDKFMTVLFTRTAVMEYANLYIDSNTPQQAEVQAKVRESLEKNSNYERLEVWGGLSGYYHQGCWDGAYAGCDVTMTWFDEDTYYEFHLRAKSPVPQDQFLKIVDSMKP